MKVNSFAKDVSSSYEKNKKKLRRSIIITVATMVAFFLIIIAFNSLSWFTGSRDAGVNGASLRSSVLRGYEVEYRAFRYDLDSDSCNEINVFDTDSLNGLMLSEYDMIFTERNKYAGILLRIDIKGEVEANETAILSMTRERNSNISEICISDISKFQCDVEDNCDFDDILDDDDLDDLWSSALTYFGDAHGPEEMHFTGNSDHLDLMTFDQSAEGETVVWLFMNYDDALVRSAVGSTSFSLSESVSVYNDCDMIKVITETNE